MDVQKRRLVWRIALAAILLLAIALRLKGIHNPILDHPGWRQGDTASIAKNFATLQYNVFYPQTNYNGPPPNYVELELQIVPIVAATLYKIVGVHEVIGRLVTIAFSVGTVALLALFGRWLFASELAGLLAALLYAIMPGSIYYGRTFTPDAAMVFFLTAALYVISRMLVEEERWRPRTLAWATALLALAFLAKPVSLAALLPIAVLILERARSGRTFNWGAIALLLILPLGVLYGYDRAVASHAEWHWASGITRLHVLPALAASLRSAAALHIKLTQFHIVLGMLAQLMLGPAITAIALLGFFFMPAATRSRTLLWGWLAGGLVYTYIVVTVERVDYYMFLLLPLAALAGAGMLSRFAGAIWQSTLDRSLKYAAAGIGVIALALMVYQNRQIIRPYYHYSKQVYRNAIALSQTLEPDTLIVMGHYDPSVLYYIGRYGWEEDPYIWTPFDEQSAISKGARYFIDIEKNRFYRNVELCAWMQRFPVLNPNAQWPVYVTDPSRIKPGAEAQWRAFRNAEKAGKAREWLDAHGICR
ncbi:MAG TPA: glycosyltransferase family 39 protein [Candidatus Baltobacteraceae bacterium]|nr:glycosyltransferase family 39 protein [Candidatus Baltobacteraceae bacterium]